GIPVLVDGAAMAAAHALPQPLAGLSAMNAYAFRWHADVAVVGRRIVKVEKDRRAREEAARAERERLRPPRDVREPQSNNIAAMETSLRYQQQHVELDPNDFYSQAERVSGRSPSEMGITTPELFHVIDQIGVKATGSD